MVLVLNKGSGLSDLLSLLQGAWETKVLSLAVELELFTRISRGAVSAEMVSQESGMDVRLIGMVIKACEALGLVVKGNGGVKNSPLSERFLVKGSDYYLGDFIGLVGENYYDMWRSLKDVVVTGKPIRDDVVVRLSDPKYAGIYARAMDGISRFSAERLAESVNMRGRKDLLEIGGGLGAYSIAMLEKNPHMRAVVFDSPFCCELLNSEIRSRGIKRLSAQEGDFERGNIPSGHDAIMLTYVLHSIPPERCEALLRRVYERIPEGGVIIVNEFLLEDNGMSPAFSALMAFNIFMLSNGGSLYKRSEFETWLNDVGFKNVKVIKTSPVILSLTAEK